LAVVTKMKKRKKRKRELAKLHELGFELIPHPSYSPDLVPREFFLFPNLKI